MQSFGHSSVASRRLYWRGGAAAIAAAVLLSTTATAEPLPEIQRNGTTDQLMVDGAPWIALGGEIHNSSASSSTYMAPIWDRLQALNLNTVIAPTYWELVEPEEGRFDFALVDDLIQQARQRDMRLVLLWFATMKNAKSTYAPEWVLADRERFPRAFTRPSTLPFAQGEPPISVFGSAARAADAKAFAALMEHLASVDPQHTVIAVQVENETGLLGDSRDRSPTAEAAWTSQVPSTLMSHLARNKGSLEPSLEALWQRNGYRRSGTWSQVFGDDWQAEEVFMAWGVSSYVEHVAAAGKERLGLPMYANAWVGPQKDVDPAGTYPAGGPVPRVFDVWRAAAPSLDWLSPDIYVDDFDAWASAYVRPGNPLFIPEAKPNVGNLLVALGQYRAIGFSPFGIETIKPDDQLGKVYELLGEISPLMSKAQAEGAIAGFALQPAETREVRLGDYTVTVRGQREVLSKMLLDMGVAFPEGDVVHDPSDQTDRRPAGVMLQLGRDEYLMLGKDLTLSFTLKAAPDRPAEIARIEEGRYVDGQWVRGRVLNGDERLNVFPFDEFAMVKIRLIRPLR